MVKVAFIGGGPGGLIAAYLLQQKCDAPCDITIFEASDRVGGKIATRSFTSAPVIYEAGVAELYGYATGPDPLYELIVGELGLQVVPMDGTTVTLGDRILRNGTDIKRQYGPATQEAIRNFRKTCAAMLSPEAYYEGHWQDDNEHDWADRTCQAVLEEFVSDPTARQYLKVAAHSDIATETHLTSGLNGLKNFLMDVSGYLYLYSVVGGIEKIVARLLELLNSNPDCHIKLHSPVVRVEKTPADQYRVTVRKGRTVETRDFDLVAIALPNNWLPLVEYGGEDLAQAMLKHHAYYDYPAHYLRVTLLFKERFWHPTITDSWFMSDAFGGCCVYDETARHDGQGYGALGWLIAGTPALTMANLSDEELIQRALDSLPEALQAGREQLLEGRVQRWLYSVNGQPGGLPVKNPKARHIPEPKAHPGLYVIGDYLFDSTLNGVLDSADFVTDMMLDGMMRKWYQETVVAAAPPDKHARAGQVPAVPKIDRHFFEHYRGLGHYKDVFLQFFNAKQSKEAIKTAWKPGEPFTVLVVGSGNGLAMEAFSQVGVEAWGVESNPYIHRLTSQQWQKRNVLGDPRRLPFKDKQFDFIYDLSLCYLSERDAIKAIKELHRVARRGVIFGAVSTDIKPQVIQRYRLFDGVKTLLTLWEWSELFLAYGFALEVNRNQTLRKLWRLEAATRGAEGSWYNDIESIRYCYFSKVEDDKDE